MGSAMSETTPKLDLPLIMPAQAQKHVTVNEALLRLDALVQPAVTSRTLDVQPAGPGEGEAWILPEGASGADWQAMAAGSLALFRDGAWFEIVPGEGWRVHVADEGRTVRYDAALQRWMPAGLLSVLNEGADGAGTDMQLIEAVLDGLTGASVATGPLIPARSILFAVSVRTMEAVTGATSFDCGLAGEPSKFGGSLGVAAGASNIGVIGPTAFYSDTEIVLSANGGDFTGGRVHLAVHALSPRAPVG